MSEEGSAQNGPPQKMKDVPKNLRPYFLGFLKKGERWNDTAGSEDLQLRQLAFLREKVEFGHYIVAGPITDGGDMVGLAIIEAGTLAEARAIMSEDPGIVSGRLTVDVRPTFLPSLVGVKVEF